MLPNFTPHFPSDRKFYLEKISRVQSLYFCHLHLDLRHHHFSPGLDNSLLTGLLESAPTWPVNTATRMSFSRRKPVQSPATEPCFFQNKSQNPYCSLQDPRWAGPLLSLILWLSLRATRYYQICLWSFSATFCSVHLTLPPETQ
jgi:hypothetical protein